MRRTLPLALMFVGTAAVASPVQSPILGGTPTAVGDYPQTVAVDLNGALCTGTLITPEWVLTAAHCVLPSELGVSSQAQVTAMIQVHFNALRADQGVAVAAMDSMPDPMFNVNSLGSHDAGLIHLAKPVTDIKPAQINFDPLMAPVGVQVTMVGYGVATNGQAGTEYVVQQTSISCLPQEGDNANLLCFDQTGGKGKCNGDSGGPSFATVNGKLLEVGITSFGDQNCQQFGADTRVDAEKDFIKAHVPNLYCTMDSDCSMGHECFENACIVTPFQPTGLGSTCTGNGDCDSQTCAMEGNTGKCSMSCTTGSGASCPMGFDCISTGASGACWPHSTDSGGCCDAGGRGAPTMLVGIALIGLVLRRRRR